MIAALSHGIIAVAQLTATVTFLFKLRKIKEITWLTKTMVMMASVSSIYYCLGYSFIYFKMATKALFFIAPVVKIMVIVNYGLLFRFVRVQVQLKAAEENSKKIIASILKSKKIECFVYVDLLIYAISFLLIQIVYRVINKK